MYEKKPEEWTHLRYVQDFQHLLVRKRRKPPQNASCLINSGGLAPYAVTYETNLSQSWF